MADAGSSSSSSSSFAGGGGVEGEPPFGRAREVGAILSYLLLGLAGAASLSCVALLHLRRRKFPLNAANVNLLIATELWILLAIVVWLAAAGFVAYDVPCVLMLLTIDCHLFPVAFVFLFTLSRLWISAKHAEEALEIYNATITSSTSSSFSCAPSDNSNNATNVTAAAGDAAATDAASRQQQSAHHRRRHHRRHIGDGNNTLRRQLEMRLRALLLHGRDHDDDDDTHGGGGRGGGGGSELTRHRWLLIGLAAVVWFVVLCFLPVYSLLVLDSIDRKASEFECIPAPRGLFWYDTFNSTALPLALMGFTLWLLRGTRDAFGMRRRLRRSVFCIVFAGSIMVLLPDWIASIFGLSEDVKILMIGFFVLAAAYSLHGFTWAFTIDLLYWSFRNELILKQLRSHHEEGGEEGVGGKEEGEGGCSGRAPAATATAAAIATASMSSDQQEGKAKSSSSSSSRRRSSKKTLNVLPQMSITEGEEEDYEEDDDEDSFTRRRKGRGAGGVSGFPFPSSSKDAEERRAATSKNARAPRSVSELKDILMSVEDNIDRESLRVAFRRYLAREFCVELMLYVEAARRFKSLRNTEQRALGARDIMSMHILKDADLAIDFALEKEFLKFMRREYLRNPVSSAFIDPQSALWTRVDCEVLEKLLDPFCRFWVDSGRATAAAPDAATAANASLLLSRSARSLAMIFGVGSSSSSSQGSSREQQPTTEEEEKAAATDRRRETGGSRETTPKPSS